MTNSRIPVNLGAMVREISAGGVVVKRSGEGWEMAVIEPPTSECISNDRSIYLSYAQSRERSIQTMPQDVGPAALFAPPAVRVFRREDGAIILSSPTPLGTHGRCIGEYLEHWARTAPDRPFLLERGPDGAWRGPTYAEALAVVRRLVTGLLNLRLSAERSLAILTDQRRQAAGPDIQHMS